MTESFGRTVDALPGGAAGGGGAHLGLGEAQQRGAVAAQPPYPRVGRCRVPLRQG